MPALKYKKKTYAGATFPVLEMTKAEYDALPSSKQNDGTVYLITDDDGGWEAERSTYDNTESGLTATNVQDALDEVVSQIESVANDSGSNTNGYYCKMSDGTAICWGRITLNLSGTMTQINSTGIYQSTPFYVTLPINLGNSNYVVTGASRYSTGHHIPIGASASTGTQFIARVYDFYARSLNDGNLVVNWQVVGRWK